MGIRDIAVSRGQTVYNLKRSDINIMPGLNARDLTLPANVARVEELRGKIRNKGFISNVTIFMQDDLAYISQGHCRMAAVDLLIEEGYWNDSEMLIPALMEGKGVGKLELFANQFTSNDNKPLEPREAAANILRIMALVGQDESKTADIIGKSRSYVSQMLTFNEQATPEVHQAIEAGEISQSQAAQILRKEGSEQGAETIKAAVEIAKAEKPKGKEKAKVKPAHVTKATYAKKSPEEQTVEERIVYLKSLPIMSALTIFDKWVRPKAEVFEALLAAYRVDAKEEDGAETEVDGTL